MADRNRTSTFTFNAPGNTNPIDVAIYPGNGSHRHTLQVLSLPTNATMSYRIFGSLKFMNESPVFPDDFVDLVGSETYYSDNPMLIIYNRLVNTVVIKVTSLSAGPAIVRYLAGSI